MLTFLILCYFVLYQTNSKQTALFLNVQENIFESAEF